MKLLTRAGALAALAIAAVVLTVPVQAVAPLTIKLATFAPANSAWHKALLDMGDAWTKATEGRVTLRVYPGGTLGTEASTVKMMSPAVNELQAALLLPPGLARINDAVDVFGMPFFLESDEEMRAVFTALRPMMTHWDEVLPSASSSGMATSYWYIASMPLASAAADKFSFSSW